MSKEIFLHIGMPKTGTSSIQNFLYNNHDVLLDKGIFYPKCYMRGKAHFLLSDFLGFTNEKKKHIFSNEIFESIDSSDSSKIVFSSENFVMNGSVEKVKNFFNGYHIKPIIYLRKHDEWWPSAYQQSVKQMSYIPWKPGFKSFYNFKQSASYRYWDYLVFLEKWANVFGEKNIIVRPYQKSKLKNGDVVEDFFSILDCDISDLYGDSDYEIVNRSMNGVSTMLIEFFKHLPLEQKFREDAINKSMNVKSDVGLNDVCGYDFLSYIYECNEKDYDLISKRYTGGGTNNLFNVSCEKKQMKSFREIEEEFYYNLLNIVGDLNVRL